MPTSVVFGLMGLTTFAAMLAFVAWAAALLVELRSLRRAVLRLGATLRAGAASGASGRPAHHPRTGHAEDERPTLPDPLPSVRPGVIASVIADASDEDDQEVTRVARRPREIVAIDEPRARPTILPPPSSS